ncbi:MAG TPA: glycosyltransferase family 2 protein [Ignavibacteria bacterium]|nr:glycosyltransferase family 2 protein [Ignavibacteria bacterium]
MSKISALIICKNEEKNIGDCIKSLLWCDEIILIDSFSEDDTVNIAQKFKCSIIQNAWNGFAEQRRFALSQVNTEWILSLDADERCTETLQNEIKAILTGKDIQENGFEIPRKSYFLNKWIRHGGWYPNYQLRFFRNKSAGVSDRLVHESYNVDGRTGKLNNDILHYTVTSVKDYMNKINSYSDLSALEKVNRKKIGYFDLLVSPQIAFFQQYFLKGNFLDGIEGLMVSRFHMITKLLNNMKIRELQTKNNQKK